jgi:hypothetical protein
VESKIEFRMFPPASRAIPKGHPSVPGWPTETTLCNPVEGVYRMIPPLPVKGGTTVTSVSGEVASVTTMLPPSSAFMPYGLSNNPPEVTVVILVTVPVELRFKR